MDKVLHFSDQVFEEEVLKSDQPVLVDFWATWCGPCHMLAPIIKELANELDGQVKVGKMDVDQNPSTAARYGIMSIPTLVLFKDGQEATRLTGLRSKSDLLETINYFLENQAVS